jgi:hypothetical protein
MNNAYKTVLIIAALSWITASAAAQSADDARVRVFVAERSPAAGGFVDKAAKDFDSTRKDLISELKRKDKTLVVVDRPDAADMRLELTESAIVTSDQLSSRRSAMTGNVTTSNVKQWRSVAVLIVDEYKTEFEASNNFQTMTASKIASDVEKWAKENRERVLAARKQRG